MQDVNMNSLSTFKKQHFSLDETAPIQPNEPILIALPKHQLNSIWRNQQDHTISLSSRQDP